MQNKIFLKLYEVIFCVIKIEKVIKASMMGQLVDQELKRIVISKGNPRESKYKILDNAFKNKGFKLVLIFLLY